MTEDDAAAVCRADAMAGAMAGAMQYGFTAYESIDTMTVRCRWSTAALVQCARSVRGRGAVRGCAVPAARDSV